MLLKIATLFAAIGTTVAQRPTNTSICDYCMCLASGFRSFVDRRLQNLDTTALLKDNTGDNQYKLLTLLVNTAVIGNYTQPNMNGQLPSNMEDWEQDQLIISLAVPGILAVGQKYNGTDVNLLQYFNGMLNSTNNGGSSGVSQSFLDGGGAAPLKMNKPAQDTSSNQ